MLLFALALVGLFLGFFFLGTHMGRRSMSRDVVRLLLVRAGAHPRDSEPRDALTDAAKQIALNGNRIQVTESECRDVEQKLLGAAARAEGEALELRRTAQALASERVRA